MAVNIPDDTAQVEAEMSTDVKTSAPDSNPWLDVSYLRSIIKGLARRQNDIWQDLNRVQTVVMPDTADLENALRWGNIWLKEGRNPAVGSAGVLAATGAAGAVIPINTLYGTSDGLEFATTSAATIATESLVISSLTAVSGIATAVTSGVHNLSSFVSVTISGADNVLFDQMGAAIQVLSPTSFSYPVNIALPTTDTGSPIATATYTPVPIAALSTGSDTNLASGAEMTLQSQITDVDSAAHATADGLTGGADQETLLQYILRYIDRIRNPVAHFNVADIVAKAKTVTGVTRVFVQPSGTVTGIVTLDAIQGLGDGQATTGNGIAIATCSAPHNAQDGQYTTITGTSNSDYDVEDASIIVLSDTVFAYLIPDPSTGSAVGGQATLTVPLGRVVTYFMRDNDDDPIPDGAGVAQVQDALNEILPANTAESDNVVLAPEASSVDFVFTDYSPNTPTMFAAITSSLQQFFAEETDVGATIYREQYVAAIQNTVDLSTGARLNTFALASPAGDVAIDYGQIGTLGTVS